MVEYRTCSRAEVDQAVEWAAREGWNPGRDDADAFWSTDPDGFVCAVDGGDVIAVGSIVTHSDRFGFMGFFIVDPERRGHGIGRDFWRWRRDTLLGRLGPGGVIGLDGVVPMADFYARGGFERAHLSARMTGPIEPAEAGGAVCAASDISFEELVRFDREHSGAVRERFLRWWLAMPNASALATTDRGEVTGLGVIRPCRTGYKLGPVFATAAATAETLIRQLAVRASGAPISLDVPEVNPQAVELAGRLGLVEDFACVRMYHGPAPTAKWENVYGVTTFELG